MLQVRSIRVFGCLLALCGISACGDAATTDNRGYTKAPLEEPRLLIKPEHGSAMDSLGSPVMPRDTLIPPGAAAQPASTTRS